MGKGGSTRTNLSSSPGVLEDRNAIHHCSSIHPMQGHCSRHWEPWRSVTTWSLEFNAHCFRFYSLCPLCPSAFLSVFHFALFYHPCSFPCTSIAFVVSCTQNSQGEDLIPLVGHHPQWSGSLGRLLPQGLLVALGFL